MQGEQNIEIEQCENCTNFFVTMVSENMLKNDAYPNPLFQVFSPWSVSK